MTTHEEEIAAVLLNKALEPLEVSLFLYRKVSPGLFKMITDNFDFKKEIPTAAAVRSTVKETLESWNTQDDFNDLVTVVTDLILNTINNLTAKQ